MPDDRTVASHTSGQRKKVHPNGTGVLKSGSQSIGKSRGGWTAKVHRVAADHNRAVALSLSPGQEGDAPEVRKLLKSLENCGWEVPG